jgi:preprotein translocase subunit SecG
VRGQANVLSRATAIFAGLFFFLSLLMAWSVGEPGARSTRSIMDNAPAAPAAPAPGGATAPAPGGATPAAPSAPSAPTR